MKQSLVLSACALEFALSAIICAQTPKKTPAASAQPRETFWQWALRVSGVSANPNTLKGGDDQFSGQLWVADLASGGVRKLTPEEGYRSPVFTPDGAAILALRGDDLVRISGDQGRAEKLYTAGGISKLVGFSLDTTDEMLVLKEDDAGHATPWRLSVKTGAVMPLPYNPQSPQDREMLENLQDWQRVYGETIVYVKRESRETLSGTVEIGNVFVKSGGRDPVNVSRCDLTGCGQPSLAADGRRVVFVKSVL